MSPPEPDLPQANAGNVESVNESAARVAPPGAIVEAPPAQKEVSADVAGNAPVTITGCLETSVDEERFRLTDAEGVSTPKSRSWRSGFLKKSAPRIALVDGPASVEAYDGRQVSVTGVLVDREMHVTLLKPIADNCD